MHGGFPTCGCRRRRSTRLHQSGHEDQFILATKKGMEQPLHSFSLNDEDWLSSSHSYLETRMREYVSLYRSIAVRPCIPSANEISPPSAQSARSLQYMKMILTAW